MMEGTEYYIVLQAGVPRPPYPLPADHGVKIEDENGGLLLFDEGDKPAPANPRRFYFNTVDDQNGGLSTVDISWLEDVYPLPLDRRVGQGFLQA